MQLTAAIASTPARRIPFAVHSLAAAAVVLALILPLVLAHPANLTSDESLYLAESHAIAHGRGLVYPSGEPIVHRAPLFPAALAPAVAVAGTDGAYAVAKTIVVMNVVLVAFIAWRIAGAVGAVAAGGTAGGSAYLNGLGTTLYLDPLECTFALLAIVCLVEALRRQGAAWFAAAGACVGLSFLVKEAAVQWAPLGVLAWLGLPVVRTRVGARGAVAYSAAVALVVAPWFAWVWLQTGTIFLLGRPDALVVALAAIAVMGAVAAGVALWRVSAPSGADMPRVAMPVAIAITITWCTLVLYMLERNDAWNAPVAYWRTVPHYLVTVAPNAQPYFLLAAALGWAGVRAWRRDDDTRLLVMVALLSLPLAIVAANRSLQLRDALPIVYVAHIALGLMAADIASYVKRTVSSGQALAIAAVAALGAAAFAVQQTRSFTSTNADASAIGVRFDSWDSDFVGEIAASMDAHVPAGATVVSSRLYFSSLSVHTEGRYQIRQMPTVGVDIVDGDQLLARRSNLFRWEDRDLRPAQPGDTWLWLKRYEGKDYWVGLGEQELLEYLRRNDVGYVLLTGEDLAFSSLDAAAYLRGNPAFTLVDRGRRSPSDQFYLYAVDRSKLVPQAHSTSISPADAAALVHESGRSLDQVSSALGTPLRVTDRDGGLSAREEQAAMAGVDLGLP